MAHDIIPVAYKLNSWHFFRVQPYCKNCLPRLVNETVAHCFWECKTIFPAKRYVQKALKSKCDMNLTSDIIRFSNLPDDTVNKDLALLFITELRYSIWICRCRVRIDNTNPLSKLILEMLMSRLNNRLILDFHRLDLTKFTQFWILPGLARLNQRGKPVSLLSNVNNFRFV